MRRDSQDLQPGAEEPASSAPSGSRRRWVAAGAVTVTVAAAAVIAATSVGGTADTDESQAASQSTATTKIVEQDLVERETVDGTLGYSDARAVVNRLGGTVTWTPRVGSVVETNHRLYEIDGQAVYLLDGAYPAYRTLQSGTEGDDVLALERNLRALDLDTGQDMSVDGTWDSGTTAAVKRWQARKGMAETGSIEKGRIVFQPGSRRIGDIAIAVGQSASTGGGGGGNEPAAAKNTTLVMQNASATDGGAVLRTASLSEPAALGSDEEAAVSHGTAAFTAVRVQDATTPTTPAASPAPSPSPSQTPDEQGTPRPVATPKPASPGGAVPAQGASRSAPSGAAASGGGTAPAASGGSAGATGDTGGTSAAADVSSTLMTTTSTKRIVAVDLEATKQALAKRGATVSVELPDGKDVDGTIATVSKVAQKKASSSQEDPPATIKVVVKLRKSTGTGLDQAPVDVSLEKTRAKDVLTVPVTALIARQGGTFAVEVRDGSSRRIVEVETGLYTDSYVEIEGPGLAAGMTVTNARI